MKKKEIALSEFSHDKLVERMDGKAFSFLRCVIDEYCCEIACDTQGHYVVFYSDNYLDDTWNVLVKKPINGKFVLEDTTVSAGRVQWYPPLDICVTKNEAKSFLRVIWIPRGLWI